MSTRNFFTNNCNDSDPNYPNCETFISNYYEGMADLKLDPKLPLAPNLPSVQPVQKATTDQQMPKPTSDFLNLVGNLKLAGSMRATNYYKDDGSELTSVLKVGLPDNVYYVDKKIGINQSKPMADIDITGKTNILGDFSVNGSTLISGNLMGKGTSVFGGKVMTENDFVVGKNADVMGNFGTQGTGNFKGLLTAQDNFIANKNANILGNLGVTGNFGTQGTSNFKGKITTQDELIGKSAVFSGKLNMGDAILLGDQNIAHPDVGHGAFYRADGQVNIATDDVIRLRHLGSKSTGIQFDVTQKTGDIQNPNGQMKFSRHGIMFGGPNDARETNSAQITAGLHIPNSLNIVGMSSDKNAASRRIDMWAEGGLNVTGGVNISGDFNANSGKLTVGGTGDYNSMNLSSKCGQWQMSGPRCPENGDFGIWYNPQPGSNNWQEQIRLSAKESKFKLPSKSQICIGDTCLNEAQIKQLLGTTSSTAAVVSATPAVVSVPPALPKPAVLQELINKNLNMYNPDAIVYNNIIEALTNTNKPISKSGSPSGWDASRFSTESTLLFGKRALNFGNRQNNYPNGLLVNVPEGKNVIWLMAIAERWVCFEVYTKEGQQLGNFSSGFRVSSKLMPKSKETDAIDWNTNYYTWIPIPIPKSGTYIICTGNKKNSEGSDCWIAGIAFSTNPWAHAMNSALAYHLLANEGSQQPALISKNFNNDQQAQLTRNIVYTLMVPVIKTGIDKLLYFVLTNDNVPAKITVNDKSLDKLVKNNDNPFGKYFSTLPTSNFVTTKIPDTSITSSGFVKVVVDLTDSTATNILFREIGTIDSE